MTPTARIAWPALLILALVAPGCQDPAPVSDPALNPEPSAATPATSVAANSEPREGSTDQLAKPTPAVVQTAEELAVATRLPARVFQEVPDTASAAPDEGSPKAIALEPVKFDEFLSRVAANKKAKYTIVDAWATWCVPCRENFPHLVEMNTKYVGKGLAVISLSFDDPTNAKVLSEAKEFLTEKKAVFPNYLLDEADGVGFEKLDINTIPAVFLFGPDAKLLKKFTLDDPDHQFTYDEVEQAVIALLDGKPLPKSEGETPSPK